MNLSATISAAVLFSVLVPCTATAQSGAVVDRSGRHELHMIIEHDRLEVSGGSPFDRCAIMLGLEEADFNLPGNAQLSVVPLVVLSIGEFDAGGNVALDLQRWGDRSGDVGAIFAQAITVRQDSEFFATSNVQILGVLTMTGPRTQPLDRDSVDTKPLDDDSVDTEPLDDDSVDTQPLDDSQRTYPVGSVAERRRVGTAPLDDDARTYPRG